MEDKFNTHSVKTKSYVEVKIQEMHGRSTEQDAKIMKAKDYVVDCIAEIKKEITRKFLE